MVLSTRVSLQWEPEAPEELTNTLVFTSKQDRFVDVRVYKNKYPYVGKHEEVEAFEQVFQWVIVGEEEELRGTNRVRFNHSINSAEIVASLRRKRPLAECRSLPDIGAFWRIEGSEDRKETGEMVNPETGKVTPYVEIWRSLCPTRTTTNTEVRERTEPKGEGEREEVNMVFDVESDGVVGRIIRLGNWVQGIVYDSNDTEHPLSVMRRVYEEGEWRDLIRYGKYQFPKYYESEMGQAKSPWTLKE